MYHYLAERKPVLFRCPWPRHRCVIIVPMWAGATEVLRFWDCPHHGLPAKRTDLTPGTGVVPAASAPVLRRRPVHSFIDGTNTRVPTSKQARVRRLKPPGPRDALHRLAIIWNGKSSRRVTCVRLVRGWFQATGTA